MSPVAPPERETFIAALVAALLAGIGTALLGFVGRALEQANRDLAVVREAQARSSERLARAALADRDERAPLYRRMRELNIVGSERRLEWIEALDRIRAQRALPELRYQIAPRRLLRTAAEGREGVVFYASTLSLELALLHEGDLLGVLADLRRAGNAYYAVRQCTIERGARVAVAASLPPRLRASCDIDLVTIHVGDAHDGGTQQEHAARKGAG